MESTRLQTILNEHVAYLRGEGGKRADLSGANLRGADLNEVNLRWANLSGANLRGADLSGANLRGADLNEANLRWANLSGANLRGADLRGANLRGADLRGANLSGADLRGADLRGADLSGANLRGANLRGANLSGAVLPSSLALPNVDAAILQAIKAPGNSLDMEVWHSCETTHCRAGWAVHLAGPAGKVLEEMVGTGAAAAIIYANSGSHPVPDWGASNAAALADLEARAAKQPGGKLEGGK